MKALSLTAIGKLDLVDAPVPAFAEDEMLVRTGAALICTSDLNDLRENPYHLRLPVVMGHEGAGTVAAVGKSVRGFKVGDRIATHPVHPCGKCANCREGLGHLCSDLRHFGLNMPGTFAEHYVVRQDRARRIPDAMDFTTAALAEPVCVCLEALSQARVKQGDQLLILGDGPFGILLARLARGQQLGRLVIAGRHDFRLARAEGAERINARGRPLVEEARAGGWRFDAVILAAGSKPAVNEALSLLKPRGRLVVFSVLHGDTPVDLFKVLASELEIIGACNDQDRFDDAVRMLSDPGLRMGELVTQRFALKDYPDAFRLAENGHDAALKVAFEFQP